MGWSYPVAEVCPGCKSTRWSPIKSDKQLSYTDDRICSECRTRYTPPTPMWAVMTMGGCSLLLFLFGVPTVGLGALSGSCCALPAGLIMLLVSLIAFKETLVGLRYHLSKPG